jgi:hypothetical protein
MNRRQVLQLGAAISTAAVLPANTLASAGPVAGSGDIFKVIHDNRFRDSLKLSMDLLDTLPNASPQQLLPVGGNVALFWYQHLSAAWNQDTTALAGVTGDRILFCLEQFARDNHVRVRWREAHDSFILDPQTGHREQLVSWLID